MTLDTRCDRKGEKFQAHCTVKEMGRTISTELVSGASVLDLFRACQAKYSCCVGKDTNVFGHTLSWTFSFCIKEGKKCSLRTVHCEFI